MGLLSRGNPGCTERLGNERLESSPTKRDVGFLVDVKLKMSHQCALVAQRASCALRCIEEGDGHSALGQPHLESWATFGHHSLRRI